MEREAAKKTNKVKYKPYRIYLIAVIGLVLLGIGGYFGWMKYNQMYNSPEAIQTKQVAEAEAEKAAILEEISKLMVLPEGDPVLFKVSDENQMRQQQAFFKDTKNDDVLLVFQASSKAIIFRPSENKIVNVGPINFDQNTEATQTKPATEAKAEDKK